MIPFFRWIARYYFHPIGEVVRGGLPNGINAATVQTISLTEKGDDLQKKRGGNHVESSIFVKYPEAVL